MGAMKTMYESASRQEMQADRVAGLSIGERIYGFVENNELLILGIVLVAVAASSLLHSYHKRFWLDEIFTIIVSTQPDLHHFAAAMPSEGNPPLNAFLTRLAIKAFGTSQISVRLVPLFGFLTALIGVYIFVRREAGRVFGILAVLLVIFGPVWRYSYEARPYGILLGSFMVAFVGWQTATRIRDNNLDRSRLPSLFCLAFGILGCAFSHFMGLIDVGVPLLVGEAVRIYIRRRVDWAILVTGMCCLPSLLLIVPMMRHTRDAAISKSGVLVPPWTIHKIHFYFQYAGLSWPQVMDDRIVALAILVALVTWSPFAWKRFAATYISDNSVNGVRTYVLWACFAASLLIPITWLGMLYGRGWYYCRYGIAASLGVVLWFCLLFAKRRLRSSELVAVVILAVTVQYLLDFERGLRSITDLGGNEVINYHPSNLPIVVSSAFFYPSIWWYASAAEKPRVVFLTSADNSKEINAAGVLAEKPYFHAPILDFETFTGRTSHFLLVVDEGGAGIPELDLRKLLEINGFGVKMIDSKNHFMLFDVTKQEQPIKP